MNLLKRYLILVNLLSPFRKSQQKTVISIVSAICQAVQANSLAIAAALIGTERDSIGECLESL